MKERFLYKHKSSNSSSNDSTRCVGIGTPRQQVATRIARDQLRAVLAETQRRDGRRVLAQLVDLFRLDRRKVPQVPDEERTARTAAKHHVAAHTLHAVRDDQAVDPTHATNNNNNNNATLI